MKKVYIALIIIVIIWKMFLTPKQIRSDVPYKFIYNAKILGSASTKKLPMLILLHGAGAHEKDLISALTANRFDVPVRVIAFRGPLRCGFGYRWAYGKGKTNEEATLAHDTVLRDVGFSIAQSTEELMKKFPTKGKPFVFGFSEGASIAYYLAVNHPDKFTAIFASSGELPKQFFPESVDGDEMPPVHVYHGKNDSIISIGSARRTVSGLECFSDNIYFSDYDTGHTFTRAAVDDMENNISEYVTLMD